MVSKILVISAPWCVQCKPLHKELSDFHEVLIVEFDAELDEYIVDQYNIRNLPTLVFLDETNTVVGRSSGFITKEQLSNKIKEINEANK